MALFVPDSLGSRVIPVPSVVTQSTENFASQLSNDFNHAKPNQRRTTKGSHGSKEITVTHIKQKNKKNQ